MKIQCIFGVVIALVHLSSQLQMFGKDSAGMQDRSTFRMSELDWKEVKRSFRIFDELNGEFIGNVLEKFSTEKNDSPGQKFISLFMRAKSKDYDFASYGDNCEKIPKLKLRDFTNMYSRVLGSEEEQLKLSNKIFAEPFESKQEAIIMQKVRLEYLPALLMLFDTSHNFCDFRRQLRCDEETKCCKCPTGMTMEESGTDKAATCRLLNGQKCNLKKGAIEKMDILVTKESRAVHCVRNSECKLRRSHSDEMNVATVEICECKPGYYGDDCEETGEINGLISTADYSWTVHRLFPEEIVGDLINLMKFRNRTVGSRAELEERARKLYRRIASEKFREEIVENDVHLRNKAKLLFGDRCSSSAQLQIKLDNPPLVKDGSLIWTDPNPETIMSWQHLLVHQGIPFCNYLRHLRCSSLSKVCECREGLRFKNGACLIKFGYPCDADFNAPFQFDALQDKMRFSAPSSPHCLPGSSCSQRALFFAKRCWCTNSSICNDTKQENKSLFTNIRARFTLNLGDECNANIHALLMNPSDGDLSSGVEKRLALLLDIANSTTQFCKIERFENCSDLSRRCQCWNDFVLQGGQCRRKNMDTCGKGFLRHNSLYDGKLSFPLWKLAESFGMNFVPDCVEQSTCFENTIRAPADTENIQVGRCICTNSKLGLFCNDSASSFASVLRDPAIVFSRMDYDDKSIPELIHQINLAMHKLETFMLLKSGDECDVTSGGKLDVIVTFWKEFLLEQNKNRGASRGTNFQKALSWVIDLIPRHLSKFPGLCDARLGMTCSNETRKCTCPPGSSLTLNSNDIVVGCKLNHKEICSSTSTKTGMGSWFPHCHSDFVCSIGKRKHENISRCLSCNKEAIRSACFKTMKNVRSLLEIKIPVGASRLEATKLLYPSVENKIKNINVAGNGSGATAVAPNAMILMMPELPPVPPRTKKEFLDNFQNLFRKFEVVDKLEIGEGCDYNRNLEFFTVFQKLLDFYNKKDQVRQLEGWVFKSYVEFYRLLQEHSEDPGGLCDWANYGECSPVTDSCVCMYRHHLVTSADKECRLKVNEVCDDGEGRRAVNSRMIQRNFLRCEDGSKCEPTDFGPSKCRQSHNNNILEIRIMKMSASAGGSAENLYKCHYYYFSVFVCGVVSLSFHLSKT